LNEIRTKKEYQKNLPTLRTEYIKIYRLKLRQATHDDAKLKELERALTAEHIARFRAIAEKEEQQEQSLQTQKQGQIEKKKKKKKTFIVEIYCLFYDFDFPNV